MAFPRRWKCPHCKRIVENKRYCYSCGYRRESRKSQQATRRGRENKKIKKLPVVASITLLALVLSLTFWNKIKALKPRNKEIEVEVECASPELVLTLRNKGSRTEGTWIFLINGKKYTQRFELSIGEEVKKAFESKNGLNSIKVKTPYGEERRKECFL